MKRKWVYWALAIIVVAAAGTYFFMRWRAAIARRAAFSQLRQTATAKVERRDLEVVVSGKGTVQPSVKKSVQPGVAGTVVQVLVSEGSMVRAGDPLLILANDSVQYQAEQARLDLALAQQALNNLLGPAGARAKAELELNQAMVNLSSIEDKIAALSIKAPIGGEIWALNVKVGDTVKAGQVIATVADTSAFKVAAKIRQVDVNKVRVGDPVQVFPGGDIPVCNGVIESIGREGTAGTKGVEFPLTVMITDPSPGLRAGMAVTVTCDGIDGSFLSLSGTVSAQDRRDIKAEVDGTVAEVAVAEGALVQQGQLIARLENQSLEVSYQQAKNSLETAKQNLANCDSQIEQQRLKVQQATVTANDRAATAAKLVVRSPIDGKVLALNVSPGDDVTANQTVAQVASVNPLYVVIPVDELDISSVSVGQSARVEVDAIPGEKFEGTVCKIAQEGQASQGITNYQVTVQLTSDRLMLGMSATVTISVAKRTNVLTLPVEAIKWNGGQAYVNQFQDGQVVQKRIKVGVQGDLYAEVVSGLEEGETVLVGNFTTTNLGTFRLPTQIPRVQVPPGGAQQQQQRTR